MQFEYRYAMVEHQRAETGAIGGQTRLQGKKVGGKIFHGRKLSILTSVRPLPDLVGKLINPFENNV